MDRRKKCGTCRFFKDADMAGSGWCRHPKRGKLHDLVLVRKEELACRNSWDQDLWEPPGEQPLAQDIPSPVRDQPVPGGGNRPTLPVHDAAEHGINGATDRVTEIAVPFERPRPPMPLTRPWTSAVRLQQNFDLPGMGAIGTLDQEQVQDGVDETGTETQPQTQVQNGAEAKVEDVPSESDRWRLADPYEARLTMNVPTPPLPDGGRDRTSRAEAKQHHNGAHNQQRRPVEQVRQRPSKRAVGTAGGQGTEPLPIEELNKVIENSAPLERGRPPMQPGISIPDSSTTPREREMHQAVEPGQMQERGEDEAPHVHVDGVDLGTGQNAEFRRTAKRASSNAPEPIDRVTWISGIARCCGNCRDFRRGPDGKTGVCTNSYAFQEQPVVQSDQLACGAGRGEWWLPHDEYWLERADTSHHTRPTPYLDAALAGRQAHTGEHGRESFDRDDYRVGR